MKRLDYPNGLTETRTYNLDGRLSDITLADVHQRHYSYDPVGNVDAIDDRIAPEERTPLEHFTHYAMGSSFELST